MLDVNAGPAPIRRADAPTDRDVDAFLAGSAVGFSRAEAVAGLAGATASLLAAQAGGEEDPEVLRSDAITGALGAMRLATCADDLAGALVLVGAVRAGLVAVARQTPVLGS